MTDHHKIIAAQFTSLDGVIEDPDGTWGAPRGGWALRQSGPPVFAGDKFQLRDVMETGALLFGRGTWQAFSQRWPHREGDFADAMNAARKYVVSSSLPSTVTTAWENSTLIDPAALGDELVRMRGDGDIAIIGSPGIVHELAERQLIDEYRLLVLPTVVGEGTRLFAEGHVTDLRLISSEVVEFGVLSCYTVVRE
jgi:dihydrofolate reductase